MSVETIYKGFGSKKALLREAMDVAVVGDAEPIPYVERPEFAALGEGTLETSGSPTASAVVAEVHERSAGIWQAIVEAASADPEVDEWRLDHGGEPPHRRAPEPRAGARGAGRRRGRHDALGALQPGDVPQAGDRRRHRAAPEYEALLVDASRRLA